MIGACFGIVEWQAVRSLITLRRGFAPIDTEIIAEEASRISSFLARDVPSHKHGANRIISLIDPPVLWHGRVNIAAFEPFSNATLCADPSVFSRVFESLDLNALLLEREGGNSMLVKP